MGLKTIHIPKDKIDKTLKVLPVYGKKLLEPFKSFAKANNLPFHILEDHNLLTNEAEIHKQDSDLWFCLEGEVVFVCGGELINPELKLKPDGVLNELEIKGAGIKDGVTFVLKPGDWLWIPPGEPHQHTCKGTVRLVIIKIPSTSAL
jgi:mannose-6-phosphate isomerase-like protein (cupin superfamily)